MKFNKYHKIKNVESKDVLQELNTVIKNTDIFVVLEKVHGANMQLMVTKDNVRFASRNNMLGDKENTFNMRQMFELYKDNAKQLFNELYNDNVKQVDIIGEHFGGIYNNQRVIHPKLKGNPAKPIQREVQYLPYTEFIVFDIRIIDNNSNTYYVDWDKVKSISKKVGFKTVPELFRGTFNECITYPIDFITKVPKLYGLEDLQNNYAEGIIIKLEKENNNVKERIIVKYKTKKFSEKTKPRNKIRNKSIETFTKEMIDLYQKLTSYINENRLINLMSKGGLQPKWNYFNKIQNEFINDCLEDFKLDNPNFNKLDKTEQKKIISLATKEAGVVIRLYIKKEGE